MKMKQFGIYFHTLRYMKSKQIRYRLYYVLRNRIRKQMHYQPLFLKRGSATKLQLQNSIPVESSLEQLQQKRCRFTFLNLSHTFESIESIDWNFAGHGKLWTYNLNYFDFLNQPDTDKEFTLELIRDFIEKIEMSHDGLEPFPIALRGINWIKYLSIHAIQDQQIDDSLYAQYYILMDNLEYHLLGNHLLENAFSLLFGAYYFQDKKLFAKAKEILSQELEEQILQDGAHFELTPMYHQIMLYRVLDCYNVMQNNRHFEDQYLQNLLREKASLMLGWLENMTYKNGSIPLLNDATDGIAPDSSQLIAYAQRLGIPVMKLPLKESGYRKFETESYELVVDVGDIGPDYIPGHAHSDTFNFELSIDTHPFIVDTGISTYENNSRRKLERSTRAHNSVQIDSLDQSEVWSSFRVARRAKIISLQEDDKYLSATHDGYKRIGVLHTRQFKIDKAMIKIKDIVEFQRSQHHEAVAFLHFSPEVDIEVNEKNQIITKYAVLTFKGLKSLKIVDIHIAKGYNHLIKSKGIQLCFEKELETLIELEI